MLQIIVCAREPLYVVAVKKPRPIALRHLQEMLDRPLESAGRGGLLAHPPQEPLIVALDRLGSLFRLILQNLGGLIYSVKRPP
jgi:hypothetical protein